MEAQLEKHYGGNEEDEVIWRAVVIKTRRGKKWLKAQVWNVREELKAEFQKPGSVGKAGFRKLGEHGQLEGKGNRIKRCKMARRKGAGTKNWLLPCYEGVRRWSLNEPQNGNFVDRGDMWIEFVGRGKAFVRGLEAKSSEQGGK